MGLTGRSAILQVHPSRRCNLRCRHCYSSSGPWESATMALPVLTRALGDARELGYDVVSVSGGEPLLFAGLLPLLRHAREVGMRTAVTTNGLLLTPRRLEELVGLVDVLAISLDGRPETHEWMRGDERAFTRMAARLPAVRESGIGFAFITTLTMTNVHELEFVFELAADSGASLVQVHPLEPDGEGRNLLDAVPDSTELGFAFFEATRLSVVHGIPAQVDLVSQADLRSAPERFLVDPPEPGQPLGQWLTPLVIETDGSVVPLSHGFGRAYALGNLGDGDLRTLASTWDARPLAGLARDLHRELVDGGAAFTNWYERIARTSASARAGAG
jgi:MoaA/NifB/PqqE/SkfB family radical SAM enzyme